MLHMEINPTSNISLSLTSHEPLESSFECMATSLGLLLLRFDSANLFPNIGDERSLYVATDTYIAYLWDNKNMKYFNLNVPEEKIKEIQGGNAYGV